MRISILNTAKWSTIGIAVAIAGACATDGADYADEDGNGTGSEYALFAPGDRVFRHNNIEKIYARDLTIEESRKREIADYKGIEGARLAHRLYKGDRAETLDGDCESEIVVGANETLWEIADLCDVSIFILSDFNTTDEKLRNVVEGQLLKIPHATAINVPSSGQIFSTSANGNLSAQAIPLNPFLTPPSVYHAQSGDTLSGIARRHNASAAAIANLNPDVDWTKLQIGAPLKLPALRIDAADKKPSVSGSHSIGERSKILEIDKLAAKPGETIQLAAQGLPPFETVSIYGGENRRSLQLIGEFTTNELGELYADTKIKSKADLGGVIFAAGVDGDYLYSPRVSILKLKK